MNRRWLAVLLVPLLLVIGGLVDRRDRSVRVAPTGPVSTVATAGSPSTAPSSGSLDTQDAPAFMPVAADPRALDSTLFCTAGSSSSGGKADATVQLSNAGRRSLSVRVTAVPDKGRPADTTVTIGPQSRRAVRLSSLVKADGVAALLHANGGALGAALVVADGTAVSSTPCASQASSSWYFPAGSTDEGATETLALFNPFPEDAVYSVTLLTPDGVRQPPTLQGLTLPASGLRLIPLNRYQDQRAWLAAAVTAGNGRLVAARLQRFDGSGPDTATGHPAKGLSLSLGVPTLAPSWTAPFSVKKTGLAEQYAIYNPGSKTAHVAVDIALAQPQRNGRVPTQKLSVAAGGLRFFRVSDLRAVPRNIAHSLSVRTTNGTTVAVDRQMVSTAPRGVTGVSWGPLAPLSATRWLLPWVHTARGTDTVGLANPGGDPVRVAVSVLRDGKASPAGRATTVAGGGIAQVALPESVGDSAASVVVNASGPIVVDHYLEILPASEITNVGVPFAPQATVSP